MTTPIDEVVADVEKATFADLCQSSPPQLQELLDRAIPLFEQYSAPVQSMALALLYGIFLGEMEGQPVPFEAEKGQLLTYEDRLKLHVAIVKVVAKEVIAAAAHPDCPPREGTH